MLAHFWEGLDIFLNLATAIHFQLRTVRATWRFEIAKLHCVHFRGLNENFHLFALELSISAAEHKPIYVKKYYDTNLSKMGCFADRKTLMRWIETLEKNLQCDIQKLHRSI